jgi:glycosyltransferase involved in cell wall biosynthesis
VGAGPERRAILDAVERAALGDRVRLLGALPQQEVRALLDRSDVVVHPSVVTDDGMMDGIPVALMEAMAAELPVVSTRVSGIPELVQHQRTGLLVPEKDARALADALARLHGDPALASRLARQGRLHVLEHFSLVDNVGRLRDRLMAAARGFEDRHHERRPRVASSPRALPMANGSSPEAEAAPPPTAQDQAPR